MGREKLTYFIGIDLAWSSRNPSGFAALHWDGKSARLVEEPITLKGDGEIVDRVNRIAGQDSVVVAIDAPLVVPNETGRRPCETELAAVFRKYEAGAHPANRNILCHYNDGTVRGEALIEQLATIGIRHSAEILAQQPTRQAFEVYPHPAMVVLFNLLKTLKYKSRSKRSLEDRHKVFSEYRNYLLGLRNATPSISLEFPEIDQTLRGKCLKDVEDRLDAVFCAYIALYYWWWGEEKCHIFGTMQDGYIVTPVK